MSRAREARLDLVRDVLDHELIDVDGVSCGMVDDIELAAGSDAAPEVVALLVGPGAIAHRLTPLFAWVWTFIGGDDVVRVPWSDIEGVDESVKLRRRASELGLGHSDRRSSQWLKRRPGA